MRDGLLREVVSHGGSTVWDVMRCLERAIVKNMHLSKMNSLLQFVAEI